MKHFLSYLIPIPFKKIPTEKNGILRLEYFYGRKLLMSTNANYSYGSLERILKF